MCERAKPRRKGRPKGYKGVLSKPMKPVQHYLLPDISREASPNLPPQFEEQLRKISDVLQQRNRHNEAITAKAWQDRRDELLLHLEIDQREPGWERDLLLMLLLKYERELLLAGRMSKILEKYDLDPAEPGQDLRLIYKIAEKHIPGFSQSVEEKEIRPGKAAMAQLRSADFCIGAKLSESGSKPSARMIAKILQDPKQLADYVSPAAVKAIGDIIQTNGNAHRGIPSPLSDTTLRRYISDMRKAPEAYLFGSPTEFQIQFVEKVSIYIAKQNSAKRRLIGQM